MGVVVFYPKRAIFVHRRLMLLIRLGELQFARRGILAAEVEIALIQILLVRERRRVQRRLGRVAYRADGQSAVLVSIVG